MKYHVQQKVLTLLRKQYVIKNELGENIYYIKSNIIFPRKLTFYNEKEEEILVIKKRYFRILKRYDIYVNNEIVAILKAKFCIFHKRFKISSKKTELNDLKIDGDIIGFNFEITKDEQIVANIGKKFISLGDKYTLDIKDEENSDVYFAIAITIDDIVHNKKKYN